MLSPLSLKNSLIQDLATWQVGFQNLENCPFFAKLDSKTLFSMILVFYALFMLDLFILRMLFQSVFDKSCWYSIAALHMAAANGHLDVVEYLINRGVVSKPSENLPFFFSFFFNYHFLSLKSSLDWYLIVTYKLSFDLFILLNLVAMLLVQYSIIKLIIDCHIVQCHF